MHAGMQLSVVGVGLPGLTGCTWCCRVLVVVRLHDVVAAAAAVVLSSFSISLVSDNSVGVFENTECVRIWKYIFISFSSAFRPSRKISRYFMYSLCDVCLMIPACNFSPCLFVVFSSREFE